MAKAADVGSSNWDAEVTQSDLPVLVDFWAPWCGPCRMLAPTVDAIAQDYEGRLKVFKCNVDENHDIAARFSVMNIPQLLLLKKGKVAIQLVGAQPKDAITRKIDEQLS